MLRIATSPTEGRPWQSGRSLIYLPKAPLLGKTPPVGGGGTFVPEGERLASVSETERLILKMCFPPLPSTMKSTLFKAYDIIFCTFTQALQPAYRYKMCKMCVNKAYFSTRAVPS